MSRGQDGSFLPRNPQLTEVEVLKRTPGRQGAWLPEESATTLAGIRASTVTMTEDLAERLAEVWTQRLTGRIEISQPVNQWSPRTPDENFLGYAPDSAHALEDAAWVMVAHRLGRRLQAGGLMDDKRRRVWG